MTNERIAQGIPERGEAGYNPVEEEQDVQDRGGVVDEPDDEVVSVGQTAPLGHMDVSDLPDSAP